MYLFVYGIFKTGGDLGDRNLFRGCTWLGKAHAPGYVLLDTCGPAAMVPGWHDGAKDAQGELIHVPIHRKKEVLRDLDSIESKGVAYNRAKIETIRDDGIELEAYAYLWIMRFESYDVLPSGSWK